MDKYEVIVILMNDGYTIFMEDGITQMEFTDGTETSGIKSQKDVWKICIDHECHPNFV